MTNAVVQLIVIDALSFHQVLDDKVLSFLAYQAINLDSILRRGEFLSINVLYLISGRYIGIYSFSLLLRK